LETGIGAGDEVKRGLELTWMGMEMTWRAADASELLLRKGLARVERGISLGVMGMERSGA
jgi:hypothetical protein